MRWQPTLTILLGLAPSGLSAQVCRSDSDAPPVIVGTVRDADRGVPLVGARVGVLSGRTDGEAGRGAQTDADGRFRLCGLSTPSTITLVARAGSRSGAERTVDLAVGGEAPLTVDLEVALDDPDATSGVFGSVVSREGRRVVAGADVRLAGYPVRRVTKGDGSFVFDRVPPGSYVLHVEHLAYRSFVDTVHLAPGRPLQLQIPVATDPIPLDEIEITVRSTIWMRRRSDLFERMERGFGHFITRAEIVERGAPAISALLRGVPGVTIQSMVVAGRYVYYPVIRGSGIPALYVDGALVALNPEMGRGIDDFLASDVDVIEIQRGPATIPTGLSGSCAGCGVIHIWTIAP
jgi:hypothetical protein